MEDVFRIMERSLEELRGRRQPNEERQDAVFRWIYRADSLNKQTATGME
jgi:hypothetical protein